MGLTIRSDTQRIPIVCIKEVLTLFEKEYQLGEGGWTTGSATIPAAIDESKKLRVYDGQTTEVPLADYVTSRSFEYLTWGPGSAIVPTLQYFDDTTSMWRDGYDPADFKTGPGPSATDKAGVRGTVEMHVPGRLAQTIANKYRLKVTITQHDCE